MFVWKPFSEFGEIFKNLFAVGMKDMRTVTMNKYSEFIIFIISIAGNMISLFNDQYFFMLLRGKPFCNYASGKPGTNN